MFAESVRESELYITSQSKKSDNVLHADGQGQHSNLELRSVIGNGMKEKTLHADGQGQLSNQDL